jgi:ubiquinone/menaquinone biosynthesis C-methylase UbiE
MSVYQDHYEFMENPRENVRLSLKVDPEQVVEKYVKPCVGEALEILDVGCGPGVIACAMGDAFPEANVVAFDMSPTKIEAVRKNTIGKPNITARLGDATSMPFETNSFDFVFSRFLLQFMFRPDLTVSEMVRVCRPGGSVMIQDLDGQLLWHYPEDDTLSKCIQKALAYAKSNLGFDPFVGRKLYSYLLAHGLEDIEVKVEPYHLFPGRIDEKNLKLWKMKFEIIMPAIVAALGSEREATQFCNAYLAYLQKEDTLTYSTVFTVSGVKPSSAMDANQQRRNLTAV